MSIFCNIYLVDKIDIVGIAGAYAAFLRGGGPNFKISGILDIHAAKRHVASSEPLLGGLGACFPKKIFKNGTISCYFQPFSC